MATIDRPTPGLPVAWHVSSRSGNGDGNCVEAGPVLDGSGRFAVRDSKDRSGPTLIFSTTGWAAFLTHLRANRLT
ncbi:DUF397 domain-containing protein [Micromonospora okii]|uniref:DUF397 domain-containing protein n=1 Tax=Micromonospora okii TaxID=1182970 RepID=UPI001E3721CE|nr:DUF397 domain-containing protein [Micromonospora okii]